METRV